MELKTLLEERVEEWVAGWKKEGFEEGIKKVLKRQLTKRFGDLPAWATEKLDAAESTQLETWADGIFDATSLEAFFNA